MDNGRCAAAAAAAPAAAAHATGELAVTPPPAGTVMVTVAPGSLETHGAMRPSASPRNYSYYKKQC